MATRSYTTSRRLFVGSNLPNSVDEKCLEKHFHDVREEIELVEIIRDSRGNSKGFGFVTFKSADAARRAVTRYNRSCVEDFQVRVEFDKSNKPGREKQPSTSCQDSPHPSSHQSSHRRGPGKNMPDHLTCQPATQTESQRTPPWRRGRGRLSYRSASTTDKLSTYSSSRDEFVALPDIADFPVLGQQAVSTSCCTPSLANQEEQAMTTTNLQAKISRGDVTNLLETCGSLQRCEFSQQPGLELMTCMAHFSLPSEATEAVAQLNGVSISRHTMTVKLADPCSVQVNILAPSVATKTLSLPEHTNELQLPQAASTYNISRPASEQFFQMLQQTIPTIIKEFQSLGVTICHENGQLVISGSSQELIESLAVKIDQFCEKNLPVTPSQWNQIMSIPSEGLSKFQELNEPFETNPNVTVIPVPKRSNDSGPVILFVGTVEAVSSAYRCFIAALNKKLELRRIEVAALRELQGDLTSQMSKKFQVETFITDTGISFKGGTDSVRSAHAEMETLLAQFQQMRLSDSSPVLSLLLSFRQRLQQESIKACVITLMSQCPCLCAFSSKDLQQAVSISENGLCERRLNLSVGGATQGFRDSLANTKKKHSVQVFVSPRELVVRGFVQSDVDSAHKELGSLVNSAIEVTQPLKCPQSLHGYLGVLLFGKKEPPKKDVDFLNSLPVRIHYTNAQVMLEGSLSSVQSAEEQILKYFIPDDLHQGNIQFTCNHHFISQIERSVLSRIHAEYKFVHTVSKCGEESHSKRPPSRPMDESYTFSVFSRNKKELEEVVTKMKAVELCTENFKISQQAIDQVENMKNQLERKYCCRIIIHRGQSPSISIHGLYKNETALCRSEIEGSLIVSKRINFTGYQLQYLKARCGKNLDRMRETCQKFSLPRMHRDQDLNQELYVLVEGKRDDVDATATELRQLIQTSKFKVEIFSITCLEFMSELWRQRWEEAKENLQEKYDVVIDISPSSFPRQHRQGFDRNTVETKKIVFNFQVYGPDQEGISEARKLFTEQENGSTEKETISLLRPEAFRLKDSLKSKKLTLSPTVRWQYDQSKLVLFAPATATSELEAAKTDVLNFIENMATSIEHIPCPDKVVAMILLAQKADLLKEVMPLAREQRVTVTVQPKPSVSLKINGTRRGKEIVIPVIKKVIKSIEESIDISTVEVPPLAAPFLATENYAQCLSKLQQRHHVVVDSTTSSNTTTGNSSNVKLQEGMYHPPKCQEAIRVSIIKGDILKEVVDVIVNAANSELKHIGGLAKAIADAGGRQIQLESKAYIDAHSTTGKLTAGDAVLLGPGKLPFKKIIHAVGPRWKGGTTDEESDQLTMAVFNSLCLANQEGLSSIALPAIGTGVYSVPENICASASLHALNNFCTSTSNRTLNDVRFVLFTNKAASVFQNYFPLDQASSVVVPPSPLATYPLDTPPLAMLPSLFGKAAATVPSSTNTLTWSWENDTHSFIPYDQEICQELTLSYQANRNGQCTISVPGKPFAYKVDFGKMQQVNPSTGYTRKIKFQPASTSEDTDDKEEDSDVEEDEEKDVIHWLYKDDTGNFTLYQPHHSAQIEGWFQSESSGSLTINKFQYKFDFGKMVQVNCQTLRERDIQRKCNTPLTTDTPKLTLSLRGPSTNLARASAELLKILQDSIKDEQLILRFSSKPLQVLLFKVARTHKLELKFESSSGKTIACLKGVSQFVSKALVEMQKIVIDHMLTTADGKVQFPAEWQLQTKTVELFSLVRGSAEWSRVEQKFISTMRGTQITSIKRVQNTWLWEKYVQHKKMMDKKNGGNVNEMELFHGTRGNDPRLIYDSEEGFDMRYSAEGMWGQANYFAVNASYSDGYAHSAVSGQKQIFLAKVLTGDSHQCGPTSLRMPPEKTSSGQVQLSQVRYDTVTGHTNGSQVYMTYDNHKAYPAYLITY